MTKPPKPPPADAPPKDSSSASSRSKQSRSTAQTARPRAPPGPTRRNASFGSTSATSTGSALSPLSLGSRKHKDQPVMDPAADVPRLATSERRHSRTKVDRADGQARPSAASPASLPQRTLSSASESTVRDTMSPSLVEAFSSPIAIGPGTTSTESTESNKTVRGTGYTATPDDGPLRTPSYPFPDVSRRRGTPLHEPFTALSPITPGAGRARDRFLSQGGASITGMMGRASFDAGNATNQDDDYPTPPLYDIVLQLSSEPGLATWWDTLARIMRERYGAHRLSLALPVDSTDIENVPWGQKASYNTGGVHIASSADSASLGASYGSSASLSRGGSISDIQESRPRLGIERPHLETRHSYAGYEAERRVAADEDAKRRSARTKPSLSRRITSHVLGTHPRLADSAQEGNDDSPTPSVWRTAESEHSVNWGSGDFKPHQDSVIHRTLCTLERELDPLLDSAGVNQVLDRNSMVVVVRNFSETSSSGSVEGKDDKSSRGEPFSTSKAVQSTHHHKRTSSSIMWKYEDYEQPPVNLWSQSPAPSPAIQDETEDNPFFPAGDLNEETFEPSSPHGTDYTAKIEAIGVDPSATILHIPLFHPLLSKPLRARGGGSAPPYQNDALNPAVGNDRKAPIAILSVLSNTVPYPRNWASSIGLLGPHLATSFQTCFQNSALQDRIEQALQRQHLSGSVNRFEAEGLTPWALGLGLDTVLSYDNDDGTSSTLGSIASPSEGYSSHSGQSPSISPLATPALATVSESPTSYFDGNRQHLERSRSSGIVPQNPQIFRGPGRSSASDHRSQLRSLELPTSTKDDRYGAKKSHGVSSGRSSPTPSRQGQSVAPKKDDPSLLHSHGANFKASFPTLPSAAFPKSLRTPASGLTAATQPADVHNIPPSDKLLRTMIDALPVQIFTAEPESGKVTWVNSKFLSYSGRSTYDVQINDPWGALHPDDKSDYLDDWTRSLRTGQQFQRMVQVRRFDGQYRQHYVRAAPLKTVDQRIVHWVGVITDFHDQHTAEMNASKQQETAQSEMKYRALANSSPQIVFAATRERGITFCNSQWPAYSGQSEEEARGVGFMEAVHADDLVKCKLPSFDGDSPSPSNVPISVHPDLKRKGSSTESSSEQSENSGDTVTAGLRALSPAGLQIPQRQLSDLASTGLLSASKDATGKQSYSTEVRLRMASGEYRWHLIRVLLAEPLVSAENDEETWYGTCTDINDHKQLEQSLKDAMDSKSRFLSNMSHEIRTPLNGIWGMTNFLIDSNLTTEQEDQVNVIRASTEGLRDLINDILDLSKVEAGMITLSKDWMHIRSVIEDVNDLTSSLAVDKGLELNYTIDTDVPSQLKGDRFRFRQVLLNVVGNAIKFTQKGEVFVHCKRLQERPEDVVDGSVMIRVDVMDTGSGFSSKEAEMLFKRFSQIDTSSTRQHGGSGLGLVISMQLVELHGGQMNAVSEIGKGSTFTFTMRFGVETATDAAPHKPLSPGAQPSVAIEVEDVDYTTTGTGDRSITESVLAESPSSLIPDGASPASVGSDGSTMTTQSMTQSSRQSSKSSATSHGSFTTAGGKLPIRFGKPGSVHPAPLFSILVLCPLPWSKNATVAHLESVLAANVAHSITARSTLEETEEILVGKESLTFSHLVLYTSDTDDVMSLIHTVLGGERHKSTSVVVIATTEQRKKILAWNTQLDLNKLMKGSRLVFLQKPIKPSKLGAIFDPTKEREVSTDVNQTSAQQAAAVQRDLFARTKQRLGERGLRVVHKFLGRVSVKVETAVDGVQAINDLTSKAPGYYDIVLMDLMMPNKDGYETCREIRSWEKAHKYDAVAIVAVSANVLDDVWERCEKAGFNDYLTKPLQFAELSEVMIKILDPEEKDQPLEYMKGGRPTNLGAKSGRR